MREKYAIKILNTTREALILDRINGDNKWYDAIEKELIVLEKFSIWKFHSSHYKILREYQKALLCMIFYIKKEDMRRKARYVVGGYKIDSAHLESYLLKVQSMRIRLLLTMTKKEKLKVMCRDAENTFPNVPMNEKVCAVSGEEFRKH